MSKHVDDESKGKNEEKKNENNSKHQTIYNQVEDFLILCWVLKLVCTKFYSHHHKRHLIKMCWFNKVVV